MEKKHPPFLSNLLPISLLIFLLLNRACLQTKAQALCLSQFALANEACSFLRPGGPREVKPEPGVVVPERNRHHRHRHRHRHHHVHGSDPKDTACCRRLSSIDDACMCEMMARMPPFVRKPKHVITIIPVEGCEVSFQCDGLI